MNFWETFKMAVKNIAGNKLRTFLTMLGIVIGVAAVIVIVGLGNGIATYMEESFASLGTNTLTLSIIGRGSARNVSVDKVYEIVGDYPEYMDLVSPTVTVSGTPKVGTESLSSTVSGVSEDYLEMKAYTIASGRNLEYMDIKDRKKVCVVGAYINQYYYAGNAVGDSIRIGGNNFMIVGVMAQESSEMDEGGTDDCIYMPYSTASRLGSGTISSYTIRLTDEELASQASDALSDELEEIFGDTDSFNIMNMSDMLDTLLSMVNVVITVLSIIAGISLFVGGIGIMNIMLVSVTERTKEIGIRKALGAKERTILSQFVTEAALTSAIGGGIGIAIGYLLSSFATQVVTMMLGENITVAPSLNSVIIAFCISAGIGILFGFLPARKAASLNPIDALRYE